jgi:RNA polymerase sigma-70 factor (ECF subfamily)
VPDEDPRARDAADVLAIRRLREGDGDALAELYDRYAETAFGLALRIVHDPAETEDVVHDAFVAVARRADQYRVERGTVAAWLLTTVRNLALDRARRRIRRAEITAVELTHEPRPVVPTPEHITGMERERSRVQQALDRLPAVQRATLEVAFFEGLSYPEIAERDGVPLGTVKSRAARALMALRAFLDGLDQTPD